MQFTSVARSPRPVGLAPAIPYKWYLASLGGPRSSTKLVTLVTPSSPHTHTLRVACLRLFDPSPRLCGPRLPFLDQGLSIRAHLVAARSVLLTNILFERHLALLVRERCERR